MKDSKFHDRYSPEYCKSGVFDMTGTKHGDRAAPNLLRLKAKDVMDPEVAMVDAGASYEEVINRYLTGTSGFLYLVSENRGFGGVISLSDLKDHVFEEVLRGLVVAKDLANQDVMTVYPDESLASCLNKFSLVEVDQLPVVQNIDNIHEVVGVITRNRIVDAYTRVMNRTTSVPTIKKA